MDTKTRNEWSAAFSRTADKISELSYELADNKDVKEFIEEMESHKKALELEIATFRRVLGL